MGAGGAGAPAPGTVSFRSCSFVRVAALPDSDPQRHAGAPATPAGWGRRGPRVRRVCPSGSPWPRVERPRRQHRRPLPLLTAHGRGAS